MSKMTQPPHVRYLMKHGQLKYIGEPCRNDHAHVGLRYARTRKCVECHYLVKNGVEAVDGLAWVKDEQQTDVFLIPTADFVAPMQFSDSRRNRSAARKAAESGQRDFHGAPCHTCGCTLRFASTTSCIACEKLGRATHSPDHSKVLLFRNQDHAIDFVEGRFIPIRRKSIDRQVRINAELLRRSTYIGLECSCGNAKRYTQRGQCIECVKTRNARKRKAAPAKTETADSFDHLFD